MLIHVSSVNPSAAYGRDVLGISLSGFPLASSLGGVVVSASLQARQGEGDTASCAFYRFCQACFPFVRTSAIRIALANNYLVRSV